LFIWSVVQSIGRFVSWSVSKLIVYLVIWSVSWSVGQWVSVQSVVDLVSQLFSHCVMYVFQALNRHNFAYADRECDNKYVTSPGHMQWRDGGEKHMNDPITVSNLQVTMTRAVILNGDS